MRWTESETQSIAADFGERLGAAPDEAERLKARIAQLVFRAYRSAARATMKRAVACLPPSEWPALMRASVAAEYLGVEQGLMWCADLPHPVSCLGETAWRKSDLDSWIASLPEAPLSERADLKRRDSMHKAATHRRAARQQKEASEAKELESVLTERLK